MMRRWKNVVWLALVGTVAWAAWSTAASPPTPARTNASVAAARPTELNGIRETRLPNGLTILTKEVHAAPVVYFAVYYRVGSVDEEVGQTGMSHLMEHMMFKGTRTRGPGAISAALQRNGADFNASTSFDRTEYHEMLAADRLELAMQIEADRMVNSVFDEAQHQKEMSVVRSEYEAGENDPRVALTKTVRLAAYQIHPYRWETIGFRADIEHFTRDEMYAYYKNYYVPNNATLVIVGDFDTPKVLGLARKYFGPLAAHPVHQHFITPEPPQEGERRVVVRRAGTTPMVQIVYHIPGLGHPDRYPLDVLEAVLSAGRTGRFFQDLVQTGLATSAVAYDYELRDPDLLTLSAVAQPGHTPAGLEQALLGQVERLQSTPISEEELARALNQAEAEYVFGRDSVARQGRELGENAMRGDWRYGETYLQHLRTVTPADVQRVAREYLVERNRTIGSFEPIPGKAPTGAPSAAPEGGGAATPPVTHFRPDGAARTETWPLAAAPSAAPASTPAQAPRRPVPTRVVLDNGLTVIVQENHANPTVSIEAGLLSAGGVFDPPDKQGLAQFTAARLSDGTDARSLLELARSLEDVGASLQISGDDEWVGAEGRALSRNLDTLLDVLADELRHPAFPTEELERARARSLGRIAQARQRTGTLAAIAFADALYPKGHPYHAPTLDEETVTLKGLKREDLVAFHARHYGPARMVLAIVGDVNTAEAIDAVKRYFGDWTQRGSVPSVTIPDTPVPTGPLKTIVVEVPDKAQTDVRYGYPGQLKRRDPDFYATVVLDTILGGGAGLSSRLALNVRDRLGLVYGIYAGHSATLGAGPFEVAFGANPANVDRAIGEVERQIRLMRDTGVSKEEVAAAVAYLTGSYPVALATNGAVAGQLLLAQIYGLGLDYIQKRNDYYRALTVDQVNAAAKKYLYPGVGALVIAGTYTGRFSQGSR